MRETMITVAGNVGAAPTFYPAKDGGEPKLRLSLATTPRRRERDSGEWRDGNTSWYEVWMRGRLAEHTRMSIAKGDSVLVAGPLEIRRWEDGERSGSKGVINAWFFGPELSRSPVQISRVKVAGGSPERGADDGEQDANTGTGPAAPELDDYATVDSQGRPAGTDGAAEEDDELIAGKLTAGL